MGDIGNMRAEGGMAGLPAWVPVGALHYIAHTETGAPIRALARTAGCHASTVLRQIRKLEMRRDDPLIDAALRKLGDAVPGKRVGKAGVAAANTDHRPSSIPDEVTLGREAVRVLSRLTEQGAVLAVATGLEKAVVVREVPGAASMRTAVVDASVAEAMALKDWIAPKSTGRIVRYQITAAGRGAISNFVKRFGAVSAADARSFQAEASSSDFAFSEDGSTYQTRQNLRESPLSGLARRRDPSGRSFLSPAQVRAGERLREDYELARMEGDLPAGWETALVGWTKHPSAAEAETASPSDRARTRVQTALEDLGPGLAEVALHCCCYLEGLETTERRLGWSARSGKIVLRIALTRLERHYVDTVGPGGPLIG